MEIDFYKKELKKYLINDEKRYNHCIGVMNMCKKLSTIYGQDVERAMKIGIMHDLAKDFSKEEKLNFCFENKIEVDDVEKASPGILHGKIAAFICRRDYQFDDEMCEAIAVHTTGKANMTTLEKILFVSDKIDETRTYEDVDYYRNLAYNDLDRAIIEIINYVIMDCTKNDKIIHNKSIESRNFLLINQNK